MDAKRMVAVLQVQEGRIVAPEDGSDQGSPSLWARRLEMEGADELLFVERGAGGAAKRDWLTAVARCLFIPFALEAPYRDGAEAAAALEAGADRVVLAARAFTTFQPEAFGRSRTAASLEVSWSQELGWRTALSALEALREAGAGSIYLRAGTHALGDLFRQAARLPLPIILRCADPDLGVEALAHGADGLAFPAGLRTAAEYKALLLPAGVPLRR